MELEPIRCVECGGTAHPLVRYEEGTAPEPGDIIPYRCAECAERFDIVIDPGTEDDRGRPF